MGYVVTRQKMDDFGLNAVEDVLKSTSGVYVQYKASDGVTLYSRGFMLQSQYDGLPNPIGLGESSQSPQPDTAFLDRVEVLQGASGLLSGAGEPGGTINLIRKRPTKYFQAHVEAELGSWAKRRIVGDISGSLLESGKVRGRLVAVAEKKNSYKDYSWAQKTGVYGALDVDAGPNTTIGATYQHQENKGLDDYGLPTAADGSFLNFPRSAFYGGANDQQNGKWDSFGINIEQKLPNGWELKAKFDHTKVLMNSAASYLTSTTGGLVSQSGDGLLLSQQLFQNKNSFDAADIYLSGPFHAFGRKHELVFGINGYHMDRDSRGLYNFNTPVNIYAFDPSSFPRPVGELPQWQGANKTKQHGAYGAAKLQLTNDLKAIAGTRISWYKYTTRAGVTTQKENGIVSPYGGLIYDLNRNLSIYTSYSDIFKPQSSLNSQGSTLDPVMGENIEIGVKGALLDNRLNGSAAVFRLEQSNLAVVDSSIPYDRGNICQGYCYVASGKVVSEGVDLRLDGEITPGWNLAVGYTFVDSKYKTGTNAGQRYQSNTPQHALHASTMYRLPGTAWTFGGNIRVQSEISYSGTLFSTPYTTHQGGVAIVGLQAKYQINHQSSLNLIANNIFDREYYSAVFMPLYNNRFGDPRNLSVTYRYDF